MRLAGLYSTPYRPDQDLGAQLQAFVARQGLGADAVVTCLPGDASVSLRLLSLPFRRLGQLRRTVPFEVEGHLPFGLGEIVLDFTVVGRSGNDTTVLAAYAQRATLDRYLSALAAAGLDPRTVEVAALASLNAVRAALVEVAGARVMLDIGARRTCVALLQDGALRGVRILSAGTQTTDDFGAFAREVRWTLLAMGPQCASSPPRPVLCGGGARMPAFRAALGKELGDPVSLGTLPISFVPALWRGQQDVFATALGLAARASARRRLGWGINLRQREFAPRPHGPAMKRETFHLASLAALAGVLALAGTLIEQHRLRSYEGALRAEIRRVFTSTLPEVSSIVDEKVQLEHAVGRLRRSLLRTTDGVLPSPLESLRLLSAALPRELSLDVDELSMDGEAIRIRGTTDSFEAAETVRKTASALFPGRDAQLKDVQTSPDGAGVDFRLIILFGAERA